MGAYYFVIATALAVLPISFIFKITIERIKENPDVLMKAQTNFFIWVALIEVIPIILVIFGFINMTPAESINELLIPGLIIIVLMGFGALFIFLQRTIDVTEETKDIINTFSMIGLAMINAIPLISIVSLIMMMPA